MPEHILAFQSISKTYISTEVRTRALRNVSLTVEEGEFLSISGPSGGGKSTLMNMAGLLDSPDEGDVHAFGHRINKHDEAAMTKLRRGNIGFVFQAFNLIEELSVRDNVEMPLDYVVADRPLRRNRAAELLEMVGLSARANHRPSQLSGGQQQRVAIARALVANPRLIVADEPTGNLDSVNSLSILELFKAVWEKGTAVIFVTHSPELAAMAPRQIVMRDGEIVTQS